MNKCYSCTNNATHINKLNKKQYCIECANKINYKYLTLSYIIFNTVLCKPITN